MLEPRRQVAARTEEECLDGSEAQPELLGDLRVRETLPLTQEDAPTLALGKMREPLSKRRELFAPLVAGRRWRGDVVHIFDLLGDGGTTAARPSSAPADIERDLEQPRELELRLDTALQRPQDVDERRLRGVLRLLAVAKAAVAEREDALAVLLVQILGQLDGLGGTSDRGMAEHGAHGPPLSRRVDGVPRFTDAGTIGLPTLASSSVRVSASVWGGESEKLAVPSTARFTGARAPEGSGRSVPAASAGPGRSGRAPGGHREAGEAGAGRSAATGAAEAVVGAATQEDRFGRRAGSRSPSGPLLRWR